MDDGTGTALAALIMAVASVAVALLTRRKGKVEDQPPQVIINIVNAPGGPLLREPRQRGRPGV